MRIFSNVVVAHLATVNVINKSDLCVCVMMFNFLTIIIACEICFSFFLLIAGRNDQRRPASSGRLKRRGGTFYYLGKFTVVKK